MKYLYQFDSIKLIAMFGVFLNHCTFLKYNECCYDFFEKYLHWGGLYVELFILLSGFFAAYTCYRTVWDKQQYKKYVIKRFVRIFPVHWTCCILSVIVMAILGMLTFSKSNLISMAATISLLQSLSPHTWAYLNAPSWTISTLWILYLLIPLMMYLIKKLSTSQSTFILLLGGGIYAFLGSLFFHINSYTVWFFYIFPLTRVISFFMGVLILNVIITGKEPDCLKDYPSHVELFALLLTILCIVLVKDYSHEGYLVSLPLLLLIYFLYYGKGIVSRVLCNKGLVCLSRYSFSFYLIHYPIIQLAANFLHKNKWYESWQLFLGVIVALIISFSLSIPIYHYIEKGIGDYIKNLFKISKQ